ncbi:MAG: hypothetical protein ACFFD9_10105 [Candidatus Thorarchaeota archaeon]
MTEVQIEVIRKFSVNEVFGDNMPESEEIRFSECRFFNVGNTFVIDNIERMPEGFCGWAWRDIYKDAAVLYFGGLHVQTEESPLPSDLNALNPRPQID